MLQRLHISTFMCKPHVCVNGKHKTPAGAEGSHINSKILKCDKEPRDLLYFCHYYSQKCTKLNITEFNSCFKIPYHLNLGVNTLRCVPQEHSFNRQNNQTGEKKKAGKLKTETHWLQIKVKQTGRYQTRRN